MESSEKNSTAEAKSPPVPGRLLALDLGQKRVGVAICDELRMTVRPLERIERRSWKSLLRSVAGLVESHAAQGVVIGLPLSLNGEEGPAAQSARALSEKFRMSLRVPVYLQDERLTTFAAAHAMKATGRTTEIDEQVDSEAAAIILRDFLSSNTGHANLNHN